MESTVKNDDGFLNFLVENKKYTRDRANVVIEAMKHCEAVLGVVSFYTNYADAENVVNSKMAAFAKGLNNRQLKIVKENLKALKQYIDLKGSLTDVTDNRLSLGETILKMVEDSKNESLKEKEGVQKTETIGRDVRAGSFPKEQAQIDERDSGKIAFHKSEKPVVGESNAAFVMELGGSYEPPYIGDNYFKCSVEKAFEFSDQMCREMGLNEEKETFKREEVECVFYDLTHCIQYGYQKGTFIKKRLPEYFKGKDEKATLYRCSSDGLYPDCQIRTSLSCFDKRLFELNISSSVLPSLFNDVERDFSIQRHKNFVLIPDCIDELNTSFRHSILSKGTSLFIIPESIAYAIALTEEGRVPLDRPFYVLNLDAVRPTLFRFSYDGCIVRLGRLLLPETDDVLTYFGFASMYIRRFAAEHHIPLSENDYERIVHTRVLDSLFRYDATYIVYFTELGEVVNITFDERIYNEICNQFEETYRHALSDFKGDVEDVHTICSFAIGRRFYDSKTISGSFKRITESVFSNNPRPVWKESLPHLMLECFDVREQKRKKVSIVPENYVQEIMVGEDTGREFSVQGVFTMYAYDSKEPDRQNKWTDLPLERDDVDESFGNKVARFNYPSTGLFADETISIKVTYDYNNENPINLVGTSESGRVFKSEWQNAKEFQLISSIKANLTSPSKRQVKDALDELAAVKKYCEKFEIYNEMGNLSNLCIATVTHEKDGYGYKASDVPISFYNFWEFNLPRTNRDVNRLNRSYYKTSLVFSCSGLVLLEKERMQKVFDDMLFIVKCYGDALEAPDFHYKDEMLKNLRHFICRMSCIPRVFDKQGVDPMKNKGLRAFIIDLMNAANGSVEVFRSLIHFTRDIKTQDSAFAFLFDKIKDVYSTNRNKPELMRSIAYDVWFADGWISVLYGHCGKVIFDDIYDFLLKTMKKRLDPVFVKKSINKTVKSNKKYKNLFVDERDYLEFALALINVRDENNRYLNPYEKNVKEFVKQLDTLNKYIIESRNEYSSNKEISVFKERITCDKSLRVDNEVATITSLKRAIEGRHVVELGYTSDE